MLSILSDYVLGLIIALLLVGCIIKIIQSESKWLYTSLLLGIISLFFALSFEHAYVVTALTSPTTKYFIFELHIDQALAFRKLFTNLSLMLFLSFVILFIRKSE